MGTSLGTLARRSISAYLSYVSADAYTSVNQHVCQRISARMHCIVCTCNFANSASSLDVLRATVAIVVHRLLRSRNHRCHHDHTHRYRTTTSTIFMMASTTTTAVHVRANVHNERTGIPRASRCRFIVWRSQARDF